MKWFPRDEAELAVAIVAPLLLREDSRGVHVQIFFIFMKKHELENHVASQKKGGGGRQLFFHF
jgi:hypothetical protein